MACLWFLSQGSTLRYFPGYSLAQRLGITPHLLSRITGTVYLTQSSGEEGGKSNRTNIGLNLKFNKTSKEARDNLQNIFPTFQDCGCCTSCRTATLAVVTGLPVYFALPYFGSLLLIRDCFELWATVLNNESVLCAADRLKV